MAVTRRSLLAGTALMTLLPLAGCGDKGEGADGGDSSSAASASFGSGDTTLKIMSGSENREVEDAIKAAAESARVRVELDYLGSVDIKNALAAGADEYDAVWPASSIWVSLGDEKHLVKDVKSTSTTPVVFGVAKQKAAELGWDATAPSTADILAAVEAGKLTFAMTNATQSNSGAAAYLAFLAALRGGTDPLTAADLADTALTDRVKALLAGVDRSSGSSDWLKDLIVSDPGAHDAMVNYESLVIQADKALVDDGNDPLIAVYPTDGIAVSDSPIGYVDRGQGSEDAFLAFQKALTSADSQLLFERAGRRCGLGGKLSSPDDKQVKASFNAAWGISTDASVLKAVPTPAADVVEQALTLYQTDLRKPSWTVWVVDYSGSMNPDGKDQVVKGLGLALDPDQAARYMIQPGASDVNILVPFSDYAMEAVRAVGSDTADLLDTASATDASGGTDIYAGLIEALGLMPDDPGAYTVAIVLMTDGQSETYNQEEFERAYKRDGNGIPVFPILFGEADDSQLKPIAKRSHGKVFDGRSGNLAATFRTVKGYN